jgi:pimeloyl-ACP methyl ester carboxylesterase
MPPNPQKEFAVTQVAKVQSEDQAFDWYRKNRNAKHQVVIFVHGFNNTYVDAVFRFAQIVHDSGTDAAPILFTWPSRGRAFDYLYDKESANYSRRALEDLILQAVNSPDVSDVTILAHSMGGWLAAEALRGVAMREKSIPAKIKNVILASPDIDIDVFRRQFTEMGPKRPHFAILTSTRDKALEVSGWLAGGVSRLGGSDLRPYAPFFDELGVPSSTRAQSRRMMHLATMPSPTARTSYACFDIGWRGRAWTAEGKRGRPDRHGSRKFPWVGGEACGGGSCGCHQFRSAKHPEEGAFSDGATIKDGQIAY